MQMQVVKTTAVTVDSKREDSKNTIKDKGLAKKDYFICNRSNIYCQYCVFIFYDMDI